MKRVVSYPLATFRLPSGYGSKRSGQGKCGGESWLFRGALLDYRTVPEPPVGVGVGLGLGLGLGLGPRTKLLSGLVSSYFWLL